MVMEHAPILTHSGELDHRPVGIGEIGLALGRLYLQQASTSVDPVTRRPEFLRWGPEQ